MTSAVDYIHTFTPAEQARLIAQADFLEPYHHAGIDLAGCPTVLEIGCGVGAQMCILARRWPKAHLIGIDRSEVQLSRAREVLRDLIAAGRAEVHFATGDGLPLDDRSVDAVCVFWVFEHVADPGPILDDAYRVLAPGGRIVTTEVFDRALYTWPACPAIAAYFAAFTTLQREFGGDPDVGLRMPGLLSSAGFTNIVMADVSPTLDHRMCDPAARRAFVDYFSDLLLSGAEPLAARGRIAPELPAAVRTEFAAMIVRRDAVFSYGAKQVSARRPA